MTGALLLMFPASTPAGRPISFLDALFTSASAATLTGLTVRDTAAGFTRFGQCVILAILQIAGLGIVFIGSILTARWIGIIGQSDPQAAGPRPNLGRFIRFVVMATLGAEGVGGVLLLLSNAWPVDWTSTDRAFTSLFTTISAVCNAGFIPLSDNLQSLRHHWTAHVVIVPLVVLGSLGFPVVFNVWEAARRRQPLILYSKLVLTTTAAMYLVGVAGLAIGQMTPRFHEATGRRVVANSQTLAPFDSAEVGRTALDASFMSASARSVGFTTIDPSTVQPASQVMLMFLMAVGGSPGSAAGGITTAAIGVLLVTAWRVSRGRSGSPTAFGEPIPRDMRHWAVAMLVLHILIASVATLCLTMMEPPRIADAIFESLSATTSSGFSTGLASELSRSGRVVIIVAMFVGRIGSLALLAAVACPAKSETDG